MSMEPSSANREEAISRTLLVIGLALVVGAFLVYHFSPEFKPGAPAPRAAAADANPPAPVIPEIRGRPVAAFDLPDLNGRRFGPADFKGKIMLVNFWATWCGPCLLEIPWFLDFQKQYGPQGFQVIAINVLDPEGLKVIKPFVEKHGMQSLNVLLGSDATAELFGGFPGLPVTFLVDRDGNYYSKHLGLVSKEDVEDEIQTLLGTSPVGEAGKAAASDSKKLDTPSPSPKG